MIYFVTRDEKTGSINGCGSAVDAPAVPAGALVCTQDQARNPSQWQVRDGALVAADPPAAAQLLAQAQAAASKTVRAACAVAITGGFPSSALGSAHTYPSGATDQANLSAAVLASLMPGLDSAWTTPQACCDSGGVWAYVPHTAAQIQQVGVDCKTAIQACLARNADLQTQITAATTVEAVQAIVWQ
jgi:hypothetical protein